MVCLHTTLAVECAAHVHCQQGSVLAVLPGKFRNELLQDMNS